jgi:hypothetical protein
MDTCDLTFMRSSPTRSVVEVSAPVEAPKLLGVPVDSLIDSIAPPPPTVDPETMFVDTILDEDTLGARLFPLPSHR